MYPSTATASSSTFSPPPPTPPMLSDPLASLEQLLRSPQQAQSALTQSLLKGVASSPEPLLHQAKMIKSQSSAFSEVAEIKMIVTQLLLAPGGASTNAAALAALLGAANLDSSSTSNNNNNGTTNGSNGQNGASRKRSANFPLVQPTQPECPVALRPAISNCSLGSSPFLPQWPPNSWPSLFAQSIRTSPTLPGVAPQSTETTTSAVDTKQWSSPSSVESGVHKTDSSAGESNIDPVGIDGSESSSTSSTCTQAMMSSPPLHQPFTSTAEMLAFAASAAAQTSISQPFGQLAGQFDIKPVLSFSSAPMQTAHGMAQPERKQRKQISDDYVKLIRQHDMSGKSVRDIQIPVPEALECDPTFTAVSEQQIVQQIVQSKKFDEMDAKDATTQLCKKLAEKRVFGPRLMAQTTVAGPNHSTYNNLPDEGIIYITHVCREVLKDKVHSEDEFWEVFREAMRKLAARCRRVRHAKKTKSMRDSVVALGQTDPLAFLKRETVQEWTDAVRMRAQNAASPFA